MCTKIIHISRRLTSLFIIWIIVLCVVIPSASAALPDKLYVGGFPFGARIKTDGVLVVAVRDVESKNGVVSPAKDAGIEAGDRIVTVNGKNVAACTDVSEIIASSEGTDVTLELLRDGEKIIAIVKPVLSRNGDSYKSGLWIRDGAAGIGTVTYVIPETLEFAGLGHGICDSDTGTLIPFGSGEVYSVNVFGITRGEKGSAGELRGQLGEDITGRLTSNCNTGVYGVFNNSFEKTELLPICKKAEVKADKCHILTTLDGNVKVKADAKIVKILDAEGQTKNFLIEITDKKLLEKTGGIVQGMSGSPIIQNGKLIGAVTHVLVDDPTRGYGIFIENMLSEAEKIK